MPRCFLAKKSPNSTACSNRAPASDSELKARWRDAADDAAAASDEGNAVAGSGAEEAAAVNNRSTIGSISAAAAVRSIQTPLPLSSPLTKPLATAKPPLPCLSVSAAKQSPSSPARNASDPAEVAEGLVEFVAECGEHDGGRRRGLGRRRRSLKAPDLD